MCRILLAVAEFAGFTASCMRCSLLVFTVTPRRQFKPQHSNHHIPSRNQSRFLFSCCALSDSNLRAILSFLSGARLWLPRRPFGVVLCSLPFVTVPNLSGLLQNQDSAARTGIKLSWVGLDTFWIYNCVEVAKPVERLKTTKIWSENPFLSSSTGTRVISRCF
jgi:hypothetical protein